MEHSSYLRGEVLILKVNLRNNISTFNFYFKLYAKDEWAIQEQVSWEEVEYYLMRVCKNFLELN